MVIKRTSYLVITISSLVIASVLALTVFGFYAYLEWKEKRLNRNYALALYDLNAELFEKYIAIGLNAELGPQDVFKRGPAIEGSVRNLSDKKIYSLKMKIAFCDREGQVVYADTVYLAGIEGGGSRSFARYYKNAPEKVRRYLMSRSKLAKNEGVEPLELVYTVEGLDIR